MANRFGNSDDPNDPYHQRYLDRITNSKSNTHKIITRSSDTMSSTSRKKQRRTETTPCGKDERKRRASSAVTPNSSDEMKMNKEFTNVQHKDNKEVEYIKTRNSSDTNKSDSEFDPPDNFMEQLQEMSLPINDHTCCGCGNTQEYCHECMFGIYLTHIVISDWENHQESTMMESDATKLYHEKYIECLRFYCWQEFGLYDTKKNYDIPS